MNVTVVDWNQLYDLTESKPLNSILVLFNPLMNASGHIFYDAAPSCLLDPNEDGYNKMALEWFNALESLNTPPYFTSSPVLQATEGSSYIYNVTTDDDNEQDKKIMKRFLAKAGYDDILMATTGQEGLSKVKSEKPDLVILDTVLPDTVGFEVCRQINQIESQTLPKIIMLTGSIDAVDAVKARQAGAYDYCVKTADCVPLLNALKNLSDKDADTQI